jgi:hypothetical protein
MKRTCASLVLRLLVITLSAAVFMHSARADEKPPEGADQKPFAPAEVQEAAEKARQEAVKAAHRFKLDQEQMQALTFKLKADAEQKAAEQIGGMRKELEEAKRQLMERQQQLEHASNELAKQQRDVVMPDLAEVELKIFKLHALPAANAAHAIETLFGARALRVAVDDRTNSVILLGKPESMPTIEALLQKLDQEAPADAAAKKAKIDQRAESRSPIFVQVFWLADGLPEGEGKDPAEVLPASVLRATKKLGLPEPVLVAQSVNSLSAGREPVEFISNVPATLRNRQVVMNAAGKVAIAGGEADVEMHVDVEGPGIECQMKGSLAIPMDHYMVLGITSATIPTGFAFSNKPAEPLVGPVDPAAQNQGAIRGAAEFGGMPPVGEFVGGAGVARQASQTETSRFAFVVQVIEADSYPPEDEKAPIQSPFKIVSVSCSPSGMMDLADAERSSIDVLGSVNSTPAEST